MNQTEHSTSKLALQTDRDPQAPRGPQSCHIDMVALRRMGMKELGDFRSVVHTITDVVCGMASQPRFEGDDDGQSYNEAGLVLEQFIEFLNGYEQAAVNVALAATPKEAAEIQHRAWTLLGFNADMADELGAFAVLAAEGARDDLAAARRERRAA